MDFSLDLWSTYTLAFLLVLLISTYVYYRSIYGPANYFKSQGIPGPPVRPIIGNLDLLFRMDGNVMDLHSHLVKTYGPVSGYCLGGQPILCVTDLSFVQEVNVKQFDKFSNRFTSLIFKINVRGSFHGFIFTIPGSEWRKRRRILSPAFSALKMKMMIPLIKNSLSRLMDKIALAVKSDKSVDASDLFSKMTMEVILATAFGRSVDVQGGQGGEVYQAAREMFSAIGEDSGKFIRMLQLTLLAFPLVRKMLTPLIQRYTFKSISVLSDAALEMLEQRKNNSDETQHKDLLQLMIDATDDKTKTKLTTAEIAADAVGFLLAGYETTSNALTFTTYLLGANPSVQERLANEIHAYLEDHPEKTMYDATHDLEYLDMVFCESLRMYPLLPMTMRSCTEDCVVNGVHIRKGVSIRFPILKIHYDPNTWEEPSKFNPERFSPEEKAKRHPCAYLPFGLGPRNCVGMRFALLEAKMILIEVLKKYKITLSKETTVPIEIDKGGVLRPKTGVFLKFTPREEAVNELH